MRAEMSYHTLDSVSECTASRAGWNVQCVQQQGNSLTVALRGFGGEGGSRRIDSERKWAGTLYYLPEERKVFSSNFNWSHFSHRPEIALGVWVILVHNLLC